MPIRPCCVLILGGRALRIITGRTLRRAALVASVTVGIVAATPVAGAQEPRPLSHRAVLREEVQITHEVITAIAGHTLPGRFGLVQGSALSVRPSERHTYDVVPFWERGSNTNAFVVGLFVRRRTAAPKLAEVLLYGDFTTVRRWRGVTIAANAFSLKAPRLGDAVQPPYTEGSKHAAWLAATASGALTVCGLAPMLAPHGPAAADRLVGVAFRYRWVGSQYSLVGASGERSVRDLCNR